MHAAVVCGGAGNSMVWLLGSALISELFGCKVNDSVNTCFFCELREKLVKLIAGHLIPLWDTSDWWFQKQIYLKHTIVFIRHTSLLCTALFLVLKTVPNQHSINVAKASRAIRFSSTHYSFINVLYTEKSI